jgi:pyruvate/2-oxoglutarate dehydrogenase complex dihydrolipoamide dehydrogenase (E3) component
MKYEYDVIVVGGGAAGLTASAICGMMGAKTLLVEARRTGGDCTWTGCIPSKTLLRAAHLRADIEDADKFGIETGEVRIDFSRVMTRVRDVRRTVYEHADSPEKIAESGVELASGYARFENDHEITIDEGETSTKTSSRYFILATGARAMIPKISGLSEVEFLTNEGLFEINTLPRRFGILGAGPVGVEMAQAFARLGSSVTLLDMEPRILSTSDAELTGLLENDLLADGIELRLGVEAKSARRAGDSIRIEFGTRDGNETTDSEDNRPGSDGIYDQLLVAAGRRPNTERLMLQNAGVKCSASGIDVDRRCRTNVRHIFAAGDVTGQFRFTHMAAHTGRIAASNALLKFPWRTDVTNVPWVLFTDPEFATLGAGSAALTSAGVSFETHRFPHDRLDRAITDCRTAGLTKVFATRSGRILGAAVLGHSAGETINELSLAMKNGISLRKMAETIHPYPTYGMAARRVADQWIVRRQMPALSRMIASVFRFRGSVREFSGKDVV